MDAKRIAIAEEIISAAKSITETLKEIPSSHGNPFSTIRNRRPMKRQKRKQVLTQAMGTIFKSHLNIKSIISQPIPKYRKGGF